MVATFFPKPKTRLKRVKAFHKAYLIFNPVSGRGDADRDLAIIQSFLSPHLEFEVCRTTSTVGSKQLAEEAIAAGAALIIASGGDDTVSAAASAVANTGIPLAIIPRGTANAFAIGLGLPLTIEKACIAILQGATRTVGTVDCTTPAIFKGLPQSLEVVTDFKQAVAARQKLMTLPEIDIVRKYNPVDEIVLDYALPMNPIEVFAQEVGQVTEAVLAFWHSLVSALKHSGIALVEWGMQMGYEVLRAIAEGIDWTFDLVSHFIEQITKNSANPNSWLPVLATISLTPVPPTSNLPLTDPLCAIISIAHQTKGRIRLKIPRLARDENYALQIQRSIQLLEGIRSTAVNSLASSITVQFDPQLSIPEMQQKILAAVDQVE